MTRQKSLPDRFPNADVVWRMKMWRNAHGTAVEMEGPIDQVSADLILMAASVGMNDLSAKHKKSMEECYQKLISKTDEPEESHTIWADSSGIESAVIITPDSPDTDKPDSMGNMHGRVHTDVGRSRVPRSIGTAKQREEGE